MHITIITGSHRRVSNSAKVASLVSETLLQQDSELQISNIDLGKNPLPIWDEQVWENTDKWNQILSPIRETLDSSDALVVISPEYSGMASPALKNFFLFWGGATLAHKPALLVSVTDSLHNGAYPIVELRASSYKNTRLLYIPDHTIIRSADDMPDKLGDIVENEQMRTISRLTHSTRILLAYSTALKPIRQTTDFEFEKFTYGV